MSRWGCLGLLVGSLLGVLLLILLVAMIRPVTPPVALQPVAVVPDLTLFLSERSASRFASQALGQPAGINFEPGGQMIVTTSVNIAGFEPVADLGLSLARQGDTVVSQLHWLQIGFLRLPARWLPQEVVELGRRPGEQFTSQLSPQFTLVGLTTTTDGINLQLNMTGQ
ncbi:MAG: hypothetical protein HYR94_20580 [Chloroflexi bacterium]|nr:hypothetical protein [Chloroflexota bacterium]